MTMPGDPSRLAVGVCYPPADYLNWAESGDDAVGMVKRADCQPASGDESKTAEGRQILGRAIASIYHFSAQMPTTSIIHGDADPILPVFRSHSLGKITESNGFPSS